jgi:4'-phosphopantetheinyl transferase EntD
MPIDITEALCNRFLPEFGQEPSCCTSHGQTEKTEARELKSAVEWTLIRAMAVADSSLRLSKHVGLGIVSAQDYSNHVLHRKEMRILSPRACRRKQIEFASGRAAAHFALDQIGFANAFPILRGQKGEPLWPEGIAGSITHCYPWSVAVAIKSPNLFTIGVDLETTERMKGADISELVCDSTELDWVRAGNSQERLTMIFSAKEAVYKACYPLCRRYIDFKDVELTWVPAQSCFDCTLLAPFGADLRRGHVCAVHCHSYAESVFSCVIHRSR